MICPNCQKPVKETWKFCRKCGAELSGASPDNEQAPNPERQQVECPVCHELILKSLSKCPYCESTLHSGEYEAMPKPPDYSMDFHIKGAIVLACFGFTVFSILSRYLLGINPALFGLAGACAFAILGYFLLLYSDPVRDWFSWIDRLTVLPTNNFLRRFMDRLFNLPRS